MPALDRGRRTLLERAMIDSHAGRSASLLVIALLSPLVQGAIASSSPRAEATKPNVIFLLVDDLEYGDIGGYGVTDIRTPQLDRLAQDGVKLTDCYANGPVCSATRAAFITGRYQQRAGFERAIAPWERDPGLPVSETSIAKLLKGNGYATALFGKWHLGYKKEFGPNAHGFDNFFGFLSGNIDQYSHKERTGPADLYENTRPVEKEGYLTDLLTDRAVQFISRPSDNHFFIYVSYGAVHWPWQRPHEPDDVRTLATWFQGTREDYARMLESVDQSIGKIREAIDRQGLTNNTLIIFTSDNGGDHLSRNSPLFHQKGTLWEGGIRVPCLVSWPETLPAGTTSKQLTITMDFTATILSAAGGSPDADGVLDGIDVLPILAEKEPLRERTFFGALIGQRRMVAEDKKLFAKGVGSISQTMAGTFCSISSRISQNGGTCVIDTPRCLLDYAPS